MIKLNEVKAIVDYTEGKLQEQLDYAESIKDSSLERCIKNLLIDEGLEIRIVNDFAPRSFEFAKYRNGNYVSNGGIIWHGDHDNGGDGSAPTFSVCLTPTKGWAIHT
jgi:hypothetical protein